MSTKNAIQLCVAIALAAIVIPTSMYYLPTATSTLGGQWYDACPTCPAWPIQPTLTPNPTPTCCPCVSPTPYPTHTPYPTQPWGTPLPTPPPTQTGTPQPSPGPTATPATPEPTPPYPTPTPPSGSRLLKYYGVDVVNSGDLATLSQYDIDTAVVMLNVYDSQSSWEAYITEANKYNINIVVWPLGGSGPCGFPYIDTDISPLHNLLDYLGPQDKFIGIVNGHEWYWSCPMTISQMTEIRRRLKDYVSSNFSREIQVWNYTGGPSYFDGQIQGWDGAMDVAITWKHCIGGAEGTCQSALDMIVQDRAILDNLGWDMEQVYMFQTFEIASMAYRMPTADEMYDWGCRMLQTNTLDGFFWYSWRNPAGYTQTLADRPDLWPIMSRVYNDCANKGGNEAPTQVNERRNHDPNIQ